MSATYQSVGTVIGTGTGGTCPPPTGIQDNDLLLASIVVKDITSGAGTPPNGWSVVGTSINPAGAPMGLLYSKIAASESGSYIFGFTTGAFEIAVARFNGQDTINPSDTTASTDNSGSGTNTLGTALSITTANNNDLLIYHCGINSPTVNLSSFPNGFTGIINSLGVVGHALGYASQTSAGTTGNQIGTLSASRNWETMLWAIKPAAGTSSSSGHMLTLGVNS